MRLPRTLHSSSFLTVCLLLLSLLVMGPTVGPAQNISGTSLGTTASGNLLINPSIDFDQPNEGATVAAGTGNTNTVDGWKQRSVTPSFSATTARVAIASPTGALAGFAYTLHTVITSAGTGPAAGELFIQSQRLKGFDLTNTGFGTANAKTLTLSFVAYASVPGNYGVSISNQAPNRSYVTTVALTATPTLYQLVIPGDVAGSWITTGNSFAAIVGFTLASGSTFQTTANSWQAMNANTTSAQTQMTLTNGATFDITGVDLRIATSPPAFQRRSYQDEFLLVQQYYRKTFPVGVAPAQNAGIAGAVCVSAAAATAGSSGVQLTNNPPMTGSPSVTTYNPSAANANWRDVTGSSDIVVSVDPASAISAGGVFIGDQTTALTAGHVQCIHVVQDKRL